MSATQHPEIESDSTQREYSWEPKGLVVFGLAEHDGKILLAAADLPDGGIWWQLPGGSTLPGESLTESLRRLWREEAGLEAIVEDLLYVVEIEHYMIFTFRVRLVDPEAVNQSRVDCCFVPLEQIAGFPRLWGREALLEWLRLRERGRRYFNLIPALRA